MKRVNFLTTYCQLADNICVNMCVNFTLYYYIVLYIVFLQYEIILRIISFYSRKQSLRLWKVLFLFYYKIESLLKIKTIPLHNNRKQYSLKIINKHILAKNKSISLINNRKQCSLIVINKHIPRYTPAAPAPLRFHGV